LTNTEMCDLQFLQPISSAPYSY